MAEAIGIASGVVGLAAFAGKSSMTLYKTISSYNSHQQRVRELCEEASALTDVLQSLEVAARADSQLRIPALAIPLKRCAKACEEFNEQIKSLSSRSDKDRTSIRDWARLRYMGEDIDGVRRLLSGYKMTLLVALTDVSIRKSSVTAESVQGYKELLNTAQADLEGRLDTIDDKLDMMLHQGLAGSRNESDEIRQIKEERRSTENCLQICTQLSNHIAQLQLDKTHNTLSSNENSSAETGSVSERITSNGLNECQESLRRMQDDLANHEKELFNTLMKKAIITESSPEISEDIGRLRDEWESTRHSMDILKSANYHLDQKGSIIENYATGDAVQFMVSTKGEVLHGKNRGLGWRTRQVGGHLDDETVRQLSRDMSSSALQNMDASRPSQAVQSAREAEFEERYGNGFKLTKTNTGRE